MTGARAAAGPAAQCPPSPKLFDSLKDVSLKLIHGSSTFLLYVAHMSSKRFCAHTTLTQR